MLYKKLINAALALSLFLSFGVLLTAQTTDCFTIYYDQTYDISNEVELIDDLCGVSVESWGTSITIDEYSECGDTSASNCHLDGGANGFQFRGTATIDLQDAVDNDVFNLYNMEVWLYSSYGCDSSDVVVTVLNDANEALFTNTLSISPLQPLIFSFPYNPDVSSIQISTCCVVTVEAINFFNPNIDNCYDDNCIVSGAVYADANGNGMWDNGESPLENFTVVIGNQETQDFETVTTNENGFYFYLLPDCEELYYVAADPNLNGLDVNNPVSPGYSYSDITYLNGGGLNFGIAGSLDNDECFGGGETQVNIVMYLDDDGDSQYDSGEEYYLEDIPVIISDGVLGEAGTNLQTSYLSPLTGEYDSFTDLGACTYYFTTAMQPGLWLIPYEVSNPGGTVTTNSNGMGSVSLSGADVEFTIYIGWTLDCNVSSSSFGVWPGDTDADGEVSIDDIFNIGYGYGIQGLPRCTTSIIWLEHHVTPWNGTFATGTNYAHADCNGDGVIDENDLEAIDENFGLLSGKNSNENTISSIAEVSVSAEDFGEGEVSFNINIGTENQPVEDLFGMVIELHLDPAILFLEGPEFNIDNSVLGSDLLELQNLDLNDGIIRLGVCKKNMDGFNGYGEVLSIIGTIDDIAGKNLDLSTLISIEYVKVKNTEQENLEVVYNNTLTSIDPIDIIETNLIYPNPATTHFTLNTTNINTTQTLEIFDIQGKLVQSQLITNTQNKVQIEDLKGGVYYVRFYRNDTPYTQKLIISQ